MNVTFHAFAAVGIAHVAAIRLHPDRWMLGGKPHRRVGDDHEKAPSRDQPNPEIAQAF
jgi:hypothetical protein